MKISSMPRVRSAVLTLSVAIALVAYACTAAEDSRKPQPATSSLVAVHIDKETGKLVFTDREGKALTPVPAAKLFKDKKLEIHHVESVAVFTASGSPCFQYMCTYGGCIAIPISPSGC